MTEYHTGQVQQLEFTQHEALVI